MAQFVFDFKINTEFSDVRSANEELKRLNTSIDDAVKEKKIDIDSKELQDARKYAEALGNAIEKSDSDGKNLSSNLKKELKDVGLDSDRVTASITRARAESNKASGAGFRNISRAAKIATQDIKTTDTQLDRLKRNVQEGVGQSIAFAGIGAISTAVASSVYEVMRLDRVMTDISIVSGKSAEQMERYKDAAFGAADSLATTADQYMQAALIFEQQGGQASDYAEDLGKATVVISNITREATSDVSEYLTATINGFELFEEYASQAGQHVADVYSHLGAVSGSDTAEMAEAMQRTATIAKLSGYEFEQTASMIATVSEATRRTPQVIGNAFKSILTSFQQLREGSEDELSEFSNKVQEAFSLTGLQNELSVFTDTGELRDARDIMLDIGDLWDRMNRESQVAISEAIAGKYQAEVFQSFMENQERFHDLTREAYSSEGVALQQQLIYMDSLDAKIGQLKNSWQEAASSLISTDFMKGLIEDATTLLKIVGSAESEVGAFFTMATPAMSGFAQVFGDKFLLDFMEGKFQRESAEKLDTYVKELETSTEEGRRVQELALADLERSKGQTEVLEGLGQDAANNYRAAHAELEQLKQSTEDLEGTFGRTSQEIEEILTTTGGFADIVSSQVEAAGRKAVESSRETVDQRLSMERETVELIKLAEQELSTVRRNAMAEHETKQEAYRASIEKGNKTLIELGGLLEGEADKTEEIEQIRSRLEELNNKSLETKKLTKKELDEELNKITEIVRMEEKRVEAQRQALEEEISKEARIAEIDSQIEGTRKKNAEQIQENKAGQVILEGQIDSLEKGAKRSRTMTKALRVGAGAITTLSASIPALISSYRGATSEGEAMRVMVDGLSGALILSKNPYAMAAGAVLGITNRFMDYRGELEKVKDMNEEVIRSFVALKEGVHEARRGVVDIESEFKAFEGVDPVTLLQTGSEEDIQRYLQLSEEVADIAPELVKYYDSQGRAIVDLNMNYDELVANKQRELDMANRMLMDNRESFLVQYEAELQQAMVMQAESSALLEATRNDLERAQEMGDTKAITKLLADMQEYSTATQEASGQIKDLGGLINANLVQPFLESNRVISDLSHHSEEEFRNMGATLQSSMADIFSGEALTDMIASGNAQVAHEIMNAIDDTVNRINLDGPIEEFEELNEQLKELGEGGSYQLAIFASAARDMGLTVNEFLQDPSSALDVLGEGLVDVNKDISDHRRQVESMEGPYDKARKKGNLLGSALGSTTAGIMAASSATAPLTGGLSLVAGATAAAAGGAVALTTSLTSQAKEARELRGAEADLARELSKKTKILDGITAGFREAAKTAEGYEAAIGEIENVTSEIQEVQSTIDQLNIGMDPNVPLGYADGMDELTESVAYLNEHELEQLELLEALEEKREAMMQGLVEDNIEYYHAWMDNQEELTNFLANEYGINVENYSTMAELKSHIDAMDAWQFRNFEIEKLEAAIEGDEKTAESKRLTTRETMAMSWEATATSIDNLGYLESASLSTSQKIAVIGLTIVDTIQNTVTGVWNTILSMMENVSWAMAEAMQPVLGMLNKILDLAGRALGLVPGLKGVGEALQNLDEGEIEGLDLSHMKGDFVDRAGDYARESIEKNEARKNKFRQEVSRFDPAAAEASGVTMDGRFVMPEGRFRTDPAPRERPERVRPDFSHRDRDKGKDNKAKKKREKKDKKRKEKEEKEREIADLELELDRYYKLENALSQIENRLEDVSRRKDQAFGRDRINIMQREQRQLAAQEKVLTQYSRALEKERQETLNYIQGKGFSVDASTGEIVNLNQRLTAIQNEANRKSGEAKEAAIENAKEIQETASRYSELTFNLIPDKDQAMKDIRATIKEIEREKVEYQVELVVNEAELVTSVRDVVKTLNEGEYNKLGAGLSIASQELDDSVKLMRFYQKKISEVEGNAGLTDADRQDLIDEYKQGMLDAISEAKGAYDELSEIQQEFVSETVEMIDQITTGYDNLADKSEKVAEALKSAYGSASYRDTERLRNLQLRTLDQQISTMSKLRTEMTVYRDSVEKGTEEWKQANEAVVDLGTQIDDSLIQKIDILNEKFAEFMEGLLVETDRTIFGSLGLEEYERQLERTLSKNEKMLSTYEKMVQVGGLMAEVNESIADATDPADAEAYRQFREEELSMLMEADEVSKDQLERAKLLWDIKMKEQALEDRKNASRMAQLVRDEFGNMTYEYVTKYDDDSSGSEARELGESRASLYDFDNERVEEANRELLAIVAETNGLIEQVYTDESLTTAERKAALDQIYKLAKEDIAEAQQDILLWSGNAMRDGIEGIKHSVQQDGISLDAIGVDEEVANKIFEAMDLGYLSVVDLIEGNYDVFSEKMGVSATEAAKATEALFELTSSETARYSKEIIERSNEWLQATEVNLSQLAKSYQTTQTAVNDTTNILKDSTIDLAREIDNHTKSSEITTKAIGQQIDQMIDSKKRTDQSTKSFRALTRELVGTSGTGGTLGAMGKLRDDMNKRLQPSLRETKRKSDRLAGSADGTAQKLETMGVKANYAYSMTKQFDSSEIRQSNDNIDLMSTRARSAASNVKKLGDNATASRQNIAGLSVALAALPGLDSGKRHYYTIIKKDGSTENVSYRNKPSSAPSGSNYVGYFDTGGYTGEWAGSSGNQEGKFLMAHEKELVLNKEDTENFLAGVEIQRQLMRAVNGGMVDVIAQTAGASGPSSKSGDNNYTIYADFPGVRNSGEIESAFRGLSLNAASYAFKNRDR